MADQPAITDDALRLAARNDEPVGFDELNRGAHLLAAVRAIVSMRPPLVVGVYGDWGEGKSSFMRVLQSLLQKETREQYIKQEEKQGIAVPERVAQRAEAEIENAKIPKGDVLTVWFNPWQHQFEEEPILPLLDAIRQQQAGAWSKITSQVKKIAEDPKFRILGKAALGVAKLAGPGWFTALTRQIGDEAREVMDSFANFRDEFEKCMEQLTRDNQQRLVIFVDDLDRCEAEYTVRIMEALKLHLLNKHCVFVLGCAPKRIKQALHKQFKMEDEEASVYLDKIVQVPLRLPRMRDEDLRRLLLRLGWRGLVEDKESFRLMQMFAGRRANPREIKRFLHWFSMERSMVEFVPGLRKQVSLFLKDRPALLLKAKMLQFADPELDDFRRILNADRGPVATETSEEKRESDEAG